jgi:hypothetical protein
MHLECETIRANPDMISLEMTFEDFQHLARLFVVGALELDELSEFEEGMRQFGEAAEKYVHDCRRLESALALSLRPGAVKEDARSRLLSRIRGAK